MSEAEDILKRIAKSNHRAEGWISKRNGLIIEAHRLSIGLREIAKACGLSHMSIKRIINKEHPQ